MTSSKNQNGGKLDHIQTTCQRFLSTTEPNKTILKVKMRLHHSAYSSDASSQTKSIKEITLQRFSYIFLLFKPPWFGRYRHVFAFVWKSKTLCI